MEEGKYHVPWMLLHNYFAKLLIRTSAAWWESGLVIYWDRKEIGEKYVTQFSWKYMPALYDPSTSLNVAEEATVQLSSMKNLLPILLWCVFASVIALIYELFKSKQYPPIYTLLMRTYETGNRILSRFPAMKVSNRVLVLKRPITPQRRN